MQESFEYCLKSDSLHKSLVVNTMKSRALHYKSRIERISSSKCVEVESGIVLALCERLIKTLNDCKLHESILEILIIRKLKQ